MDPLVVFGLVVALLFLLLAMECPVAFALTLAGFTGIALTVHPVAAHSALAGIPFTSTAVYGLAVIPLYILMGSLAFHAGIPQDLYAVTSRLMRRFPGALAVATIAACTGFAAVSGSSAATAATMARVSVDEMRQRGYPTKLATGVVAAAGGLGMIIPPSIVLVVYAFISGESIARMLMSGVGPGLILALAYMCYAVVRFRRLELLSTPSLVGVGVRNGEERSSGVSATPTGPSRVEDSVPLRNLPFGGVLRALVLCGIVVAGIQGGIVTVTESGALAAVIAFLMVMGKSRREGVVEAWRLVCDALADAARTTSMALTVLVGASIFAFYLVSSRLPVQLSESLLALDLPAWLLVATILALLIPLGMFLEPLSCMLIVVPISYPIVTSLGYDGVWFGLLVIMLVEIGMLTPPVGLNVFVVADAVDGVNVGEVFRGVLPFIGIAVCVVALIFAVPELALWIPDAVVD